MFLASTGQRDAADIADRGAFIGVAAPTHTKLTEIVKKVERHELKAAPALRGG